MMYWHTRHTMYELHELATSLISDLYLLCILEQGCATKILSPKKSVPPFPSLIVAPFKRNPVFTGEPPPVAVLKLIIGKRSLYITPTLSR